MLASSPKPSCVTCPVDCQLRRAPSVADMGQCHGRSDSGSRDEFGPACFESVREPTAADDRENRFGWVDAADLPTSVGSSAIRGLPVYSSRQGAAPPHHHHPAALHNQPWSRTRPRHPHIEQRRRRCRNRPTIASTPPISPGYKRGPTNSDEPSASIATPTRCPRRGWGRFSSGSGRTGTCRFRGRDRRLLPKTTKRVSNEEPCYDFEQPVRPPSAGGD